MFLLNSNRRKQNTQKAVAVGADIFDRIMAGGSRAPEKIPAPDIYGCAVASFAANSNIPSTFTGKGEPLAKYKFRQMVHEYLPSAYRNRAYQQLLPPDVAPDRHEGGRGRRGVGGS